MATHIGNLPEDAIDLGHNTFYTKLHDKDQNWSGIHEWHQCKGDPEGEYSAGFVGFEGKGRQFRTMWKVESYDPLTLSPSLACGMCGHHGFIRNGRWEPV